jgi:alkanesulfonate monooxygenase SsuD/methylene tetrahydromethanopterin reductase-like flavin-dependent oxidoreductase (luciferase family)
VVSSAGLGNDRALGRKNTMRLGLFMMPLHPGHRTLTETMEEDAEKSLLADRLGFQELWVGEHYSATTEPIPSPMMFMAPLIGQTKLTFGTAVINMPNHHPAILAAEAAQLDHMSRGRFHLGVGPGGLVSDFELFDCMDPAVRYRMLGEAIDMVQRIWAQDGPPYDLKGQFWTIKVKDSVVRDMGIGFMPKPFQKGGPPITLSLASRDSSSAGEAARKGWNIISANISPPQSVASHWRVYSEAMAKAGKRANGDNWRVARCITVAPSEAEAKERAFGDAGSSRYLYTYVRQVLIGGGLLNVMKPRVGMSDAETTVDVITEACVIYGSPKTALDKLIAFRDEVGPFGTLLMTGLDWSGPNRGWEQDSMRLLAEEVMPRFRQHVGATAPAE